MSEVKEVIETKKANKQLDPTDARVVLIGGAPTVYPTAKIVRRTVHQTRKMKLT